MNNGSFTYNDYHRLYRSGKIHSNYFDVKQIQPSSVDLTLSEECYEIEASFLSSSKNVRENLKLLELKKINLNKKYIFKKNKTYLVKLNENLAISKNMFGICNPKSSTGRLDVFCRTILNHSNEYEKIPNGYKGEMFIEITSKSFNIEFKKGDSLNQMRLIYNKRVYLTDNFLRNFHNRSFLTFDFDNKKIDPHILNGLKISVDLSPSNEINAYKAKHNAPTLCFNKVKKHKIKDYWHSIKIKDKKIIIKKNNFYILRSKEKIQIPNNMAGEMIPYDTSLGDFRVHYAGFFDPGFGNITGSYAVLEVKTNEVPFFLEDGQSIATIKFSPFKLSSTN